MRWLLNLFLRFILSHPSLDALSEARKRLPPVVFYAFVKSYFFTGTDLFQSFTTDERMICFAWCFSFGAGGSGFD